MRLCVADSFGSNVHQLFSAVLIFAVLVTAGCGSQHGTSAPQPVVVREIAPGRIIVDVLERRGREHYYVYTVTPSNGSVDLASTETFADFQHEKLAPHYKEPSGAIGNCASKEPAAESPDRSYVASCTVDVQPSGRFARKYAQVFLIHDKNTGNEVLHWKLDEQRLIRGFAWSPNSKSIALLSCEEAYGKGPLELISAWVGHPVPHCTVSLYLIPVSSMQPIEYRIRNDVLYAYTRILDWSVD